MIPLFGEGAWYRKEDCDLDAFRALVEQPIDMDDYPHCDCIEEGAVVYGERTPADNRRLWQSPELQAELGRALSLGPGVVVVRRAFDPAVIDRVSDIYFRLIDEEKLNAESSGDHFGTEGSNDRLWSALEKLALTSPDSFCDYYRNVVVEAVSLAWLGPQYQIISEINCVNPGSPAQVGHRDYHLGLPNFSQAAAFPIPAHRLSAALTLQVAIAHTDMPNETGPTLYLPHSHQFGPGFLAMNLPGFQAYFEAKCRQVALARGDVLVFNPAVMHAAGANSTPDVRRLIDLLQISSAFGRPVATVHRAGVLKAIYPTLRRRWADEREAMETVVAAAAEGYPFPTNMERDRPGFHSRTPQSQADLVRRALAESWEISRLSSAVAELRERRRSSLDA
jgi:ectoine hydroxylase-related dioxygenase (phytanoyl-CoA dioxygenase family)